MGRFFISKELAVFFTCIKGSFISEDSEGVDDLTWAMVGLPVFHVNTSDLFTRGESEV